MIEALVLAAGASKRMGQPKVALPWGRTTVLQQILNSVREGGVQEILVVTGAAREVVEDICRREKVRLVFNPSHSTGEMLSSLQTGILALLPTATAALIVLGDQPQMVSTSVRAVIEAYGRTRAMIVVPSYHMRRGHPWLIDRKFWPEILALATDSTPRHFLAQHAEAIAYVEVDSPTILEDLDSPDQYLASRPSPTTPT
jgi:molybdenum cofactor cytidylyltransferase